MSTNALLGAARRDALRRDVHGPSAGERASMSALDLRSLAFSLLHEEVLRLAEYDARRYELDVVNFESYSKSTTNRTIDARTAELEYYFEQEIGADTDQVSAHLNHLIARLARKVVPLARLHLRTMAQQAPRAVARALAQLVAEHRSSASALLFAYFTLKGCIEESRACEAPVAGSEDRFRDEVAEFYSENDSPEAINALVREWVLPPKAAVAQRAAFAVVVEAA